MISELIKKEFLSAPEVLRSVISANQETVGKIVSDFKSRKLKKIITLARGSGDNAAAYFRILTEYSANILTARITPCVINSYNASFDLKDTLVLAFSRSGKSFDILSGVRNAKKDGAYVVSITAEKESELSALSDSILLLADKDKDAITAPKTLLSQMVLCYMLAQALSGKPYDNLLSLPDVLNDVVSATLENIKLNAAEIKSLDNYIILSRGLDYIAAAELSLKLSEICHKFSRPFSTGEFIFGPIAMVDETRNIILVAPDSEFTKEYTDIARRLSLLGVNKIIALSDVEEILEISDVKIAAPKTAKEFAPFVYVLISELLSSYIGQHLNIQNSKVRHAKRDEL